MIHVSLTFVAERGSDLADVVLQARLVHLVEPEKEYTRINILMRKSLKEVSLTVLSSSQKVNRTSNTREQI